MARGGVGLGGFTSGGSRRQGVSRGLEVGHSSGGLELGGVTRWGPRRGEGLRAGGVSDGRGPCQPGGATAWGQASRGPLGPWGGF